MKGYFSRAQDNYQHFRISGLTDEIIDAGSRGFIHDDVLIEDAFAEAFDA